MAGIGKYKKGAKFTLKSGNSPAFKMIGTPESGDSPITNEFGIGKGASPYKGPPLEIDKEKGGGWKKAAKIGLAAITSGLDAVYGSGKIMPSESLEFTKGKKKKKKDKKKKDKDNEEAVVTTQSAGQSVLEKVQKQQAAEIEPE